MDVGHNPWVDETARSLVSMMNRTGYGIVKDYVALPELARMRAFVGTAVEQAGGAYVGFTGPEAVAGSGLDTLAASSEFRALIERLYEVGTGRQPVPDPFHQVLRCLTGKSFSQHSLVSHYGSYILTVLFPIGIPITGRTGDLVMLANTRAIRSGYCQNLVDKVALDNRLSQYGLRMLRRLKWLKLTRLALRPGNAYFFWGYRSVHTNEPCDPNAVRATALFHYANPHAGESRRLRRR